MTFTLAHPAAILPLLRSPFSRLALLAGAVAPDLRTSSARRRCPSPRSRGTSRSRYVVTHVDLLTETTFAGVTWARLLQQLSTVVVLALGTAIWWGRRLTPACSRHAESIG